MSRRPSSNQGSIIERLRTRLRRIDWASVRYRVRHFDKRLLIFVPALAIIGLVLMYADIAVTMASPTEILAGQPGLEIMDRDGKVFYTVSDQPGSNRVLPLDQISPNLINATVASEDANYWTNSGVNLKGMLRAVYENLAFWNGGLFHGSGGSSISQQLAKNIYIDPKDRYSRNPLRKLKETLIAFELNRRYSKNEILQWYLSNIFYGNGAYGIESASYRYFNKAPSDLTLSEAALLAGIPQSPIYYDPVTNPDAAKTRQTEVLGLMVKHGVIDQAQADAALAEPIDLREGELPDTEAAAAPDSDVGAHFAQYVRDLLPKLLGQKQVNTQLRVTTTLDYDLQVQAEDILKSNLDKFETQYGATNGALVSMDPKTGEILAMVGSHDFERADISGQVNNALALNNPGSTMKAVTYLAAFMKGWSPSTLIDDAPLTIQNGDSSYVLNNADLRYRGVVPARVALGSSLNVPAVKTEQYAGLDTVYNLAKKMGVSTLKDLSNYGIAFTLGGNDVDLLDMTYVYSVFANQGQQAGMDSVLDLPAGNRDLDPVAVLKIETVDGKVLWQAKERTERIVPANAAYLITNVLSDDSARVSEFGANSALNLAGRPAAVKSGLSDDARDAWSIGYTPQLVTGIWVGNANNTVMQGATSLLTAVPIWNAFMTAALKGKPVVPFDVPSGIKFVKVCVDTGQPVVNNNCSNTRDEVFLDTKAPATSPTATLTPTPKVSATATTPTVSPTQTSVVTATVPATRTATLSPTPRPSLTPIPPSPTRPASPTLIPLIPTHTPVPPQPTATTPPTSTVPPSPTATKVALSTATATATTGP